MADNLEARIEAQLEELHERLHECLAPGRGPDAAAAQGILRELIAGYQLELSALRRLREGPTSAAASRGAAPAGNPWELVRGR